MPRTLAPLVVIAHWIVAVSHLFLVARILAAPGDKVSWLAILLMTLAHWGITIVLWTSSDRLGGLVSLIWRPWVPIFTSISCTWLQTIFSRRGRVAGIFLTPAFSSFLCWRYWVSGLESCWSLAGAALPAAFSESTPEP
jgi:hypothetical protein